MFGYLSQLDGTFAAMDRLSRRMARSYEPDSPRASVYETEAELIFTADVPGLKDKDIEVSFEQDVLSIRGERKIDAPEGYGAHRRERRPARFSRSFTVPFKVEADKLSAELKDGVLTVRLPKAPEAKPRKIPVKVG